MKKWTDLTQEEQAVYKKGEVKIQCFVYDCRYKFISEEDIEMYLKWDNYPHYTHYKSLVADS